MWDLPGPGTEPMSPALAGRFLTTEPPRKPWKQNTLRRDIAPCQEQERERCFSVFPKLFLRQHLSLRNPLVNDFIAVNGSHLTALFTYGLSFSSVVFGT